MGNVSERYRDAANGLYVVMAVKHLTAENFAFAKRSVSLNVSVFSPEIVACKIY